MGEQKIILTHCNLYSLGIQSMLVLSNALHQVQIWYVYYRQPSVFNTDFCVHKSNRHFTGCKKFLILQPIYSNYLKCKLVNLFNYINPIKTGEYYYFNYVLSSFEVMCIALSFFSWKTWNYLYNTSS